MIILTLYSYNTVFKYKYFMEKFKTEMLMILLPFIMVKTRTYPENLMTIERWKLPHKFSEKAYEEVNNIKP